MVIARFRWVPVFLILVVLIIPLLVVGAAQTVIVDFSKYANGTPVTALLEPNMIFTSTGGVAAVDAGNLFLNAVGTIEVSLSVPATSVSFPYWLGGLCAASGSIELFLGGISVDNTGIPVCVGGTFAQAVTFDHLVISTGGGGGTQVLITGPMTFTFPDAATTVSRANAQFQPGDGRINHAIEDRAAPAAIYCEAHGIQVRRIDPATSIGIDPPAINLFYEEIEAAGVPNGENLLLAENDGVALYRLTTGEFQVNILNANTYEYKWYIFVWDQCPVPSVWYHLAN